MVEKDDAGRFTPDHTDADVLAAVRAHEPAATSEVGDELGISRQGADRRLRQLRDEGRVASKKIGASLVWFDASDSGDTERREAGAARADVEPDRSPDAPDHRDDAPEHAGDRELEDDADLAPDRDVAELVDDVVAAVSESWTDDDDRLADRRDAARAVLAFAVDSGDAVGRSEAVERFRDEHPVDGQNAETWWRQNARRVLAAVGNYSTGENGYVVTVDDLEAYLAGER